MLNVHHVCPLLQQWFVSEFPPNCIGSTLLVTKTTDAEAALAAADRAHSRVLSEPPTEPASEHELRMSHHVHLDMKNEATAWEAHVMTLQSQTFDQILSDSQNSFKCSPSYGQCIGGIVGNVCL